LIFSAVIVLKWAALKGKKKLSLGDMVIVRTRKTHLKLRAAFYEVVWPLLADGLRVTRLAEEIGHISHVVNPGRESSRI
jgi:hypothetical protein